MTMEDLKSTSRRQWDVRGVEINGIFVPATPRVDNNTNPTRRVMSRNPSPMRRSMSRNPSSTRNPSPTRRRSVSKAPSPTRAASSSRRRRSVSRNPSPQRGRSRQQCPPSTSGIIEPRPASHSRRMSTDGPRARALPSDSENETEPRFARKLDRSFSRGDSSGNENFLSSRSARGVQERGMRAGSLRRASSTPMEIRRSLTTLNISDTSTAGKDGDEEVQGEEVKTIHEVCTHTKVQTLCDNTRVYDVTPSSSADAPVVVVSPASSVKNSREAPPGDSPDFVTLLNTRCADVHRAVSNARGKPEHVIQEDNNLRKVLDQKFNVWSEYATEEGKCLHLAKSGKVITEGLSELKTDELDLEVTLPEEDLKPQPMDAREESDNTWQSLDEEAARYLEECVIVANFDANVADDISISTTTISDGETTVCGPSSRRQTSDSSHESTSVSSTKAIVPLDDEGMLLPWLDWEPEVDLGRKERMDKASVVDNDDRAVNVDEFLSARTLLQPRISYGRMLVCGGKR